MDTVMISTDRGLLHRDSHLIFNWWTTSNPDVFDVEIRPFRGSVSKVYHVEPATITWYGGNMWREKTATSDFLYSVEPASKNGSANS